MLIVTGLCICKWPGDGAADWNLNVVCTMKATIGCQLYPLFDI